MVFTSVISWLFSWSFTFPEQLPRFLTAGSFGSVFICFHFHLSVDQLFHVWRGQFHFLLNWLQPGHHGNRFSWFQVSWRWPAVFYRLNKRQKIFSELQHFAHFGQKMVPVVSPWKQSTANSFGQMQITSLTPQPKSILQQGRGANPRRRRRGRNGW